MNLKAWLATAGEIGLGAWSAIAGEIGLELSSGNKIGL